MKKLVLFFIVCLLYMSGFAQNPTYQQKLFYTCKVWGFVKYYHSEVSTCHVNWDSVLVANLPIIKNAGTQNDFNDALDSMLIAAGPMAIATTNPPAPLPPELRRNTNFNWINDPMLRNDIQIILDTIKNNFRPHPNCWVQDNQYTNSYGGWLVFPFDSLMLNANTTTTYPDEWNRSLVFFKYWNIMNYFNPYNYVWNGPWDSTLNNYAIPIAMASTSAEFYMTFKKISANINDAHAEGLTWSSNVFFPNSFHDAPLLKIKYIPGKYVAVKSGFASISRGDEIVSINGLTTSQWEDSLRPYVSAGDSSVFRRYVAEYILYGPANSAITINTNDSLGNSHTINTTRNISTYSPWFTSYYPNDTLANTNWQMLGCNVGYVNMGILTNADVNSMYNSLQYTSAIIFDIRNYPNGTAWSIANLIFAQQTLFSKDLLPDVTYPGTFYWYDDYIGLNGNAASAYHGKVIVLMNEETQSQAEYSCMIFDAMPNVVNVGSQTAGTDGNITYFRISPDLHAGFTTLGIFYPNGDSTERIGIVPDSVVYPTQIGLRQHRDEVLEKALEIAGCWLPVSTIALVKPTVTVYPNPSAGVIHVELTNLIGGEIIFEITDLSGRLIIMNEMNTYQKNISIDFDIHTLSSGLYVLTVKTGLQKFTQKIIKE